jgi:hypothetical protein
MAKGKRGYLSLLLLLLSLSLPLCHCPCLPLQPRCNNCRCHGRCLRRYRCRLLHLVDCCLPPQFLLLSATAIATVAAAATADTVSATVAVAVHPHRHRHCPYHPCTCPLCRPPATSPSPLSTSSQSPSLAHHPRCHRYCRRRHRPLRCTTPSLATIAITLLVARHPHCSHHHPYHPSPLCRCPHHPPHAHVIRRCPPSWSCSRRCSFASHRPPLMLLSLVDCCFLI